MTLTKQNMFMKKRNLKEGKMVRTKPEIIDLMEEVCEEITRDEELWGRWYNKEEEEAKIWAGIRLEERKMAREEVREEARKEVIQKMLESGMKIEEISQILKISIAEVQKYQS